MLEIISIDGLQNMQFECYNELFDYIVKTENHALLKRQINHKQGNWSFTIYPPKQVSNLLTYANEQDSAVKEAYEEALSLIEICTGSYKYPTYIVNTPNTDMEFLKRKWCLDYCTYHDFILRDYAKMYRSNLCASNEDQHTCMA